MKNFIQIVCFLACLQGCELISAWEDRPFFGEDIVVSIINDTETTDTLLFKYSSGMDPLEAIKNPALDSIIVISRKNSDTSFVWDDPIPATGSGWALVTWKDQFEVLAGYERSFEGGDLQVEVLVTNDSLSVTKWYP